MTKITKTGSALLALGALFIVSGCGNGLGSLDHCRRILTRCHASGYPHDGGSRHSIVQLFDQRQPWNPYRWP